MSLISNIAHKIPSSSSFGTISVSYFSHVDTDDLGLYHINLYKDVVVLEFIEFVCVFGSTPFKKPPCSIMRCFVDLFISHA